MNMMKEREVRLSMHSWGNSRLLQSQDVHDMRRLTKSNVLRRRGPKVIGGSPKVFKCFGPKRGRSSLRKNMDQRPYRLEVSWGRRLLGLRFLYAKHKRIYKVDGGVNTYTNVKKRNIDFKPPAACTTRVDFKTGSCISGIRFRSGKKYSGWF